MLLIQRKFISDYDICVFDISTSSGVRPAGRTVDNSQTGRQKHGLVYVSDGCIYIAQKGRPDIRAGVGSLIYIPKNLNYLLRYEENHTGFVLLNFDIMTANGEFLTFREHAEVLTSVDSASVVENLMRKIEASCLTEDARSVFQRKELVYRLLMELFGEETTLPNPPQAKFSNIMPGVELMQRTYLKNIPITEFAKACNISVSSFRGLFTEYFGLPPVQYRNHLRIKRAVSLLTDGNCTVAEAAEASGFENLSYFCRLYKRFVGETPGETQERVK